MDYKETIDMKRISPMMQQYLQIKNEHQDHILFFRLGDFYEMFFDDAVLVSKELELTLTGKDCGLAERAPMCGVPHHSCDQYIKKLIEKGYKVAICEQVEDPASAKGIVKREVVRVITAGTLTDSAYLDEAKNNYICSVFVQNAGFGVCFADISTGEVTCYETNTKNVTNELLTHITRFSPSEIIFNSDLLKLKNVTKYLKEKLNCVVDLIEDEQYEIDKCIKVIDQHFPQEYEQIKGKELIARSLGGLVYYLNETQKDSAKRLVKIQLYNDNQYMSLDQNARKNLELVENMSTKEKKGSLLWILDHTKTSMGRRMMRKVVEQPLVNYTQITNRQNAVKELLQNSIVLGEITDSLSKIYDIERIMTKVFCKTVNPREIKTLSYTASNLPYLKQQLDGLNKSGLLSEIYNDIDTLDEICNLVENTITAEPPMVIKDGNVIKPGVNPQLDELRDLFSNVTEHIAAIEQREKEVTGIKNLKIGYNRVFGYYIEVTKLNVPMVPDTYIRKQTLTNCERYITQELKDLENKILSAGEKINILEQTIFNQVVDFVLSKIETVQTTASAIAYLDVLCSFANVASQNDYSCPDITLDSRIEIRDGRHPVVEKMLKDVPFVPNDCVLDNGQNNLIIITGPNMAGKSTYMRQIAIITLMAQIGSFVPAKSASIGIVDKIFTRVGASDDLSTGKSTFMVEMSEVADILKNATKNSLIVLDEIGRGTSTYDGMSIAKSVIEYILTEKKLGAKTLFATHYHELTDIENKYDGVKNYSIAVKKQGEDIVFLRKIIKGAADDSYGIDVARLAGVPQKVVDRAKEILKEIENGERTIVKTVREEPLTEQITFGSSLEKNEAIAKLEKIDENALTPIEALNLIFELKSLL